MNMFWYIVKRLLKSWEIRLICRYFFNKICLSYNYSNYGSITIGNSIGKQKGEKNMDKYEKHMDRRIKELHERMFRRKRLNKIKEVK